MRRLKKIDDDWLNGESVSEKIVDNGITSFSDKELLKMAIDDNSSLFSDSLARDIVNVFDRCTDFNDTFSKLSSIEGLDMEKAIALASMVEFGRRRTNKEKKKATNPQSLFEIVRHYFDAEQERFIVVGTNGATLPISLIQSVSNSSGNLLTISFVFFDTTDKFDSILPNVFAT